MLPFGALETEGFCANEGDSVVAVVQLVEHQIVVLIVAGSSPVSHPKLASLVKY